METIQYDDFKKVELRAVKVTSAERVEGSEKLLRIQVDLGTDPSASSGRVARQIVAGIGKRYAPEDVVGKQIIIVANLEPRSLMGIESQGMLLAADSADGPVVLVPDKEVLPGAAIK
ncbi:methionine--tRNA ligase subunit beta [Candidatus Azambacteria bacterium]|nr:methionine--tRNA ligase subunit beta [Candidatus Azambacteria bacterium]MBI3685169.1 methionine--tRNA ligase subunit beta [Candidatus Azambacteria bacterium]